MRKQYEETLKTFFHERLICRRYELGLTQEETAHRLAMGSRSYADLDKGKNGCGEPGFVRFSFPVPQAAWGGPMRASAPT